MAPDNHTRRLEDCDGAGASRAPSCGATESGGARASERLYHNNKPKRVLCIASFLGSKLSHVKNDMKTSAKPSLPDMT